MTRQERWARELDAITASVKVIHVYEVATGRLLDADAIVSPYLFETSGGLAVKRGRSWASTTYPGFELAPGEVAVRVHVRLRNRGSRPITQED